MVSYLVAAIHKLSQVGLNRDRAIEMKFNALDMAEIKRKSVDLASLMALERGMRDWEARNLLGTVTLQGDGAIDLEEARQHVIRTLFKVTENVLKRPTQPLKEAENLRFLLIVLANPSLYPTSRHFAYAGSAPSELHVGRQDLQNRPTPAGSQPSPSKKTAARESGSQHTGILKRIFGLLSNSSELCQRYVIGWFAKYDQDRFEDVVDLVASFVTHRITRRSSRPRSKSAVKDGGLIPDLTGSAMNTSAQLHSAMGLGGGSVKKLTSDADQEPDYVNDWQIKAAAKFMSLLFAANNIWQGQRRNELERRVDSAVITPPPYAQARRSGQLLHTSCQSRPEYKVLDVDRMLCASAEHIKPLPWNIKMDRPPPVRFIVYEGDNSS